MSYYFGDEDRDEELAGLSFGSLKRAEEQLESDEEDSEDNVKRREASRPAKQLPEESDFFERPIKNEKKKHNKHAPMEESSKKRVPRIRQIPGLEPARKYHDIRFNRALGALTPEEASKVRSQYRFLDEYREHEVKEMEALLHDAKFLQRTSQREIEEMQRQVQSMKGRLETLRDRDLEQRAVKEHMKSVNAKTQTKFHLKKSEKRRVVHEYKRSQMSRKQVAKSEMRKRKRQRGVELRQLEGPRP